MIIDYRSIIGVQRRMVALESMRQSKDDLSSNLGRTVLEKAGEEIWLRVKVTDPEVAQLVLMALVYDFLSVNLPGLELLETRLLGDREQKAIKEWLDQRIKEME